MHEATHKSGKKVTFSNDILKISFDKLGFFCPKEFQLNRVSIQLIINLGFKFCGSINSKSWFNFEKKQLF